MRLDDARPSHVRAPSVVFVNHIGLRPSSVGSSAPGSVSSQTA